MEPKSVIELVVGIALVVIIGFLVISMMQLFLTEDGAFYKFITTIVDSITEKCNELISNASTYGA